MQILLIILGGVVLLAVLFLLGYRKVVQGQAVIKKGNSVYFQYYWQLLGKKAYDNIDLTLKKIAAECREDKALECADGVKLELRVVALIRVKPDVEGVKQVAKNFGTGTNAEAGMLMQLEDALEKAVRDTGDQIPSVALVEHETEFKKQVIQRLGLDKTGFQMDSLALEFVDPELLTKTRYRGN